MKNNQFKIWINIICDFITTGFIIFCSLQNIMSLNYFSAVIFLIPFLALKKIACLCSVARLGPQVQHSLVFVPPDTHILYNLLFLFEPGHEKMCLMSYANNKGADQPAHPRSLISAFVVRCLDIISRFYSRNFKTLASFCGCAGRFVSGLVGLCLAWSKTPEDTFCHVVAHLFFRQASQKETI